MASPTVVARTETQHASSTTLTIDFTQTTGDLVVIFLGVNDTARTLSTVGDSFTDLTAASATFHILYKVLTGSEGGNVAVTVAAATKGASLAYNIQGFSAAQNPEFSAVATGTDTGPDPGTVTPTGGAKDYLWLAAFRQNGEEADDDTWTNSAPATPSAFGNLIQKTSGTGGLANTNGSVAAADLASNASSMNPGVFNTDQSLAWRAYIVAVHPAVVTNVNAENASGTGTAYAAAISEAPAGGLSAGTGAAFVAAILISVAAALASGSGTAFDATVQISKDVTAEVAAGTGTAYTPAASVAGSSGAATGTGSGGAPAPSVGASPAAASGSGAAYDATVSTGGATTNANAGLASGAGSAYNATVSTSTAIGWHPWSDTYSNPVPSVSHSGPPVGAALVSREAGRVPPRVRVPAGVARGNGRAYDATTEWNDDETAMLLLLLLE